MFRAGFILDILFGFWGEGQSQGTPPTPDTTYEVVCLSLEE